MLDLVMIVKDEAEGIEATLRSFLPFCQGYAIVDTGSTDDTVEIIRRVAADLHKPGVIAHVPFTGYAQARNAALDLHLSWERRSTHTLMADADDRLEGGAFLRDELPELDRVTEGRHPGYYVMRKLGEMTWDVPLILRASERLRYEGIVHEAVTYNGPRVPRIVCVTKQPGPRSREKTLARWQRDLELLAGPAQTDPRSAFYYAQTLECLDRIAEAEAAYGRRAQMITASFVDETCVARWRQARLQAALGFEAAQIERTLLAALVHDPQRPEVFLDLARLHDRLGDDAKAIAYARRALRAPARSVLFREPVEAPAAELLALLEKGRPS